MDQWTLTLDGIKSTQERDSVLKRFLASCLMEISLTLPKGMPSFTVAVTLTQPSESTTSSGLES